MSMTTMDYVAEAAALAAARERVFDQFPPEARPHLRGTKCTSHLDPHRYTQADVDAITALLPDGHVAELGDPTTYAAGYCVCCGGSCRNEPMKAD